MPEFGVAVKAMIRKEGKFLIIKKSREEDIAPETLDIPGGRVEFGEQLEEALVREVREETGIDINVLYPTNAWTFTDKDFQLVGITFLCEFRSGEIKLSDEHVEYEWVTHEDMKSKNADKWFLKEFEMIK